MREVLLLGASGSIGSQTIDVLKANEDRFLLRGISVGYQFDKALALIEEFPSIDYVCVRKEEDYLVLKERYPDLVLFYGDAGLGDIVSNCPCDMVVNALVGFSGLIPSLKALENNKILCLANKESLVVGGELIRKLLNEGKGKLYPIDSEHVAIAKLLSSFSEKEKKEKIDKIWITASGGSFRNKTREELKSVTKEEALAHPTWSMGNKITIDSATMMNKGFEIIEACHLFSWPLKRIEVLMHDESEMHSALLLKDGTIMADISKPDMHGPIEYALFEGDVEFDPVKGDSLEDFSPLHFHEFDPQRYPAVAMAISAYKKGGIYPCVLNGANEEAVHAFLNDAISFLDIEKCVKKALDDCTQIKEPTLEDLIKANAWARRHVLKTISEEGSL